MPLDAYGVLSGTSRRARRPDGEHDVFLDEFSRRADRTDADGHPV
ncbi:hypothetical protein ACFWUZ_12735 [Streptomyces sp. NPDC058646]